MVAYTYSSHGVLHTTLISIEEDVVEIGSLAAVKNNFSIFRLNLPSQGNMGPYLLHKAIPQLFSVDFKFANTIYPQSPRTEHLLYLSTFSCSSFPIET